MVLIKLGNGMELKCTECGAGLEVIPRVVATPHCGLRRAARASDEFGLVLGGLDRIVMLLLEVCFINTAKLKQCFETIQ